MAKATASPPARRHNGDRLRGKAKPQRHQTKETPPPKHESAWKHENKPGLHSPFSLNQIGTLSRRHLAQFVSAIDTSLDEAYHIIASKTFVDLTHAFGPDTPVWSGFGQARMSPAIDPKTHQPYTIEKDGFRATYYEMAGQYGTHIDPPAHFAKDGITMDKIPLGEMILPL